MHTKGERKFVITLKSSSVEISVINLTENVQLLFSDKKILLEKERLDSSSFTSRTLQALDTLLKEKLNQITEALSGSHNSEVIFHSPWFLPEIISKKNRDKEVGLKYFFKENVKPPNQKDYRQVENKIINISVNGYQITKLRDIKATEIDIDIFRSYISNSIFENLKKVLNENIPQIKNIESSTSTMQCYETIKDSFVSEDNIIYLNVGGEITEIGIIENDILNYTGTFPIGSHEFSRNLEQFVDKKNNLGVLKLLSDKNIDERKDLNVDEKINNILDKWSSGLLNSLNEASKELPKKILFFANSDIIDFFMMIVENNEKLKNFEFIPVKRDVFENKVVNIENLNKNNVEYLLSAYYLSIKS